jgi:hypothetical protein
MFVEGMCAPSNKEYNIVSKIFPSLSWLKSDACIHFLRKNARFGLNTYKRLGPGLVTLMVTQNLVSIVFASSSASRGASLKALDPPDLAARTYGQWAACLRQSRMAKPPRSGAQRPLRPQTDISQSISVFGNRHSLHQRRVPNEMLCEGAYLNEAHEVRQHKRGAR